MASEAAAYEGVMLTGYYENASPNAASPASITLLGVELEVADGAAAGAVRPSRWATGLPSP